MFTKLLRKLSLFVNSPKKGDIYYGDSVWWIIPRPIELVLHGLKDKYGNLMYDPVPSKDCFRLTVANGAMDSYYVLDSEVFCRSKNSNVSVWMKRTQPRRMSKETLEEFILSGILRKG